MGTVRADAPRLDARDVPTPRGQPRRLAFGRGPLPPGSELELRTGALADELAALAGEGVQSLLLEGGPTLAGAFLEADLVDKLLVFTAPVLAGGDGSTLLAAARISASPDPSRRTDGGRGRPARSLCPRAVRCDPMSTSPEFQRTDDEIVSLLSQWVMRTLGNDELRKRIEEIGTAELAPGQRTAVDELLVALANAFPGERGELEMVVRETVESLAYGE